LGWSFLSAQVFKSTNDLIAAMLSHEDYDTSHRGHFSYLSKERSDRTGGHLWTEKIVEITAGKLRMLVAEDGQPLSGGRASAEKARLAEIVAHPYIFQKQEQAQKDDEEHAKEMLDLLPKAFLFLNEAGLFAAVYGRESFTRDDRFHIGGSAASEIALP
jgi:hypothetical protein